MIKSVAGSSGLSDVSQELADYRLQLGLPIAGSENDRATVAKLEIGEKAKQLDLEELEVISPSGREVIKLK